jgi:DNA (cytosine-5)-methyltransferase 1
MSVPQQRLNPRLRVAGLFAGIGGIELGLDAFGHETQLLCELDGAARRVLHSRFDSVDLHDDVTTLKALPEVDLVVAGFPCQDLSQAGRTAGIRGGQSSLVSHVFRLLDSAKREPRWLLLENVPFMLQLDRGQAMTHLTTELGRRGYRWAYRVVDARSFGLPQRRQRVLLLASRVDDPRPVLFGEEHGDGEPQVHEDSVYGFYWTEGLRGLGLAVDAVPTLKGGSTLGIPSPPAIWMPDAPLGRQFVTPDIRDAERLQGFPADWTLPATADPARRNGPRWKLVGNAVSVPMARWLGERLSTHPEPWDGYVTPFDRSRSWPRAAWGERDRSWQVHLSVWPRKEPFQQLADFLQFESRPLSRRASAGFYERTQRSSLRFPEGFTRALQEHRDAMDRDLVPA